MKDWSGLIPTPDALRRDNDIADGSNPGIGDRQVDSIRVVESKIIRSLGNHFLGPVLNRSGPSMG